MPETNKRKKEQLGYVVESKLKVVKNNTIIIKINDVVIIDDISLDAIDKLINK